MELTNTTSSQFIESQKQLKHTNPFLKYVGNFSMISCSQPSREDYLKNRPVKKRTKVHKIQMSAFNVAPERPKGLSEEAWDESKVEDDDFIKRIIRGEKRNLFSKMTISRRTEQLFVTAKLRAELKRKEQAEKQQKQEEDQPKILKLYQTAKKETPTSINKSEHKSPTVLSSISPVKPKQKLPPVQNPQTSDPMKKNRPLVTYNQKELAKIKAESYLIMEHPSCQLILAHHIKQSLEIASLTKIMTFYVVCRIAKQFNINLITEVVEVHAYFQEISGTTAQLIEGDLYTIEQLLYGLMLPSGNDAAMCLADWGGKLLSNKTDLKDTVKLFVQEMNRISKELGLKDTRFGNPHGLPHTESRSTAYDVAQLTSICMNNVLFRQIVNTKEYKQTIRTSYGVQRLVEWQDIQECRENTNKLLRRPGFIGVKTGITVTAGPCLVSCYQFRGKSYITVVLRTNKVSRRFKETRKILSWTLKQLFQISPQEKEVLDALRRNRRDFDSDNSEDEQFVRANQQNETKSQNTNSDLRQSANFMLVEKQVS